MIRKNTYKAIPIIIAASILFFLSCQKEKILTDPALRLDFSIDTVMFDTVFSSVGSRTIRFSAINNNDGVIRLDKIKLAHGDKSEFIMNVNGIDGFEHSNIDIPANDSVIIFMKASINENGHDTIAIHQDSIEFFFNSTYQDIDVMAYGQDVHQNNSSAPFLHMQGIKPYAITKSFTIAEGKTLRIEKGVRLLMWANTDIIIEGTLIIEGTIEEPVYITSYNPEHFREGAAGDWGSVIFRSTSKGNSISNCIISNGVNGLKLETDGEKSVDLKMENTILQSFSYAALLCEHGTVDATNCVIANAMQYGVLISRGGSYSFIHSTIANYRLLSGRQRKLFQVSSSDFYDKYGTALDLKELIVKNSIIYSSDKTDIELDAENASGFNCSIDYSLMNLNDELKEKYAGYLSNIIYFENKENLFTEKEEKPISFMLDSLSQANDTANIDIAKQFPFDINGTNRFADTLPDLGAYEYIYIPDEE